MACLNDYNIPDSKGAYYIMAAGGTDSSNTSVNTSDIYNTSSQSWITAPAMKLPRAQFTLTSVYNDTKCVVAVGGLQVWIISFTHWDCVAVIWLAYLLQRVPILRIMSLKSWQGCRLPETALLSILSKAVMMQLLCWLLSSRKGEIEDFHEKIWDRKNAILYSSGKPNGNAASKTRL